MRKLSFCCALALVTACAPKEEPSEPAPAAEGEEAPTAEASGDEAPAAADEAEEAADEGAEAEAATAVMVDFADAEFVPADPDNPDGPAMALISGDPATGPSRFLMRFPPGHETGLHTHSATYRAVTIIGVNEHGPGDGSTSLTAGSFWEQPGGEAHTDTCASESPCIAYVEFDGPIDRTLVDTPAENPTARLFPAESLEWGPMNPDEPGPEVALVAGDFATGPSSFLIRMPPGAASPQHTHDFDYTAVVVAGPIQRTVGGGEPVQINVGGYWTQPAGEVHNETCPADGGACVGFVQMGGPMTFHPAEAAPE